MKDNTNFHAATYRSHTRTHPNRLQTLARKITDDLYSVSDVGCDGRVPEKSRTQAAFKPLRGGRLWLGDVLGGVLSGVLGGGWVMCWVVCWVVC